MNHAETIRASAAEVTPELIESMWRLFAPGHFAGPYQAPSVARDRAYGPDERHRLDVHRPTPLAGGVPVLLFVPGGGFVAGDKHNPGTPYYDHIGGWAAGHGLVGVTMNYRLAPGHPWPSGAQDVASAVAWVHDNIAEHGGDPARIVVAGHSAGAAHIAGYLAGHGGAPARVAAAVLLSGIYDLHGAEHNELLRAYYGADPAAHPARAPLPACWNQPYRCSTASPSTTHPNSSARRRR